MLGFGLQQNASPRRVGKPLSEGGSPSRQAARVQEALIRAPVNARRRICMCLIKQSNHFLKRLVCPVCVFNESKNWDEKEGKSASLLSIFLSLLGGGFFTSHLSEDSASIPASDHRVSTARGTKTVLRSSVFLHTAPKTKPQGCEKGRILNICDVFLGCL